MGGTISEIKYVLQENNSANQRDHQIKNISAMEARGGLIIRCW